MDEDDAQRRRMIATLLGGAVVLVLGIWLAHAFYGYLKVERCQEEGHRFCTPPIAINGTS